MLSTRQWICEGHRVSSGVPFLHSQNLRRRHILRYLTGGRFPTPPALQRLFVLIIIRKIDNSIGWSCGEESGSEIASQSTKNDVKNTVPGFEVAASSISWSSARAEVSEVAALQLQRNSRSHGRKYLAARKTHDQHEWPRAHTHPLLAGAATPSPEASQIGRASCRERV